MQIKADVPNNIDKDELIVSGFLCFWYQQENTGKMASLVVLALGSRCLSIFIEPGIDIVLLAGTQASEYVKQ